MGKRSTALAILLCVLALSAAGCARTHAPERRPRVESTPSIDTVVHAFDTDMTMRLVDRIELDNFLRDRDIHVRVVDGAVSLTGDVRTALEKERVAELIRSVPGVVDVVNDLDIRPPR